MKKLLPLPCGAALLLAAAALCGCSGDDGPAPFTPVLPAWSGDNVLSVEYEGDVASCYDWAFTYSGGRLTAGSATYHPSADGSDFAYSSTLAYGAADVAVTNSNGDAVNVTLNSDHYITRMTVNLNTYTFEYDRNGRLTAWEKVVREQSFGQTPSYKTSATISYSGGDLSRIVYTGPDNKPVTLTFTASTKENHNGLLPATTSKELGCLGFEHLYYAGLLGRATEHLVASVAYAHTDGTADYTTTYSYGEKGRNTVLCAYLTPEGKQASVVYRY